MFRWLDGPGAAFRHPLPNSTNYLGAYNREGQLLRSSRSGDGAKVPEDTGEAPPEAERQPERQQDLRPFPMNPHFQSQAVLDEPLREEIYNRVHKLGKSVRTVSAELGVEMNRVGAVVRLKTIEKEWARKGKPLARPYAEAVLSMLPRTPLTTPIPTPHESINDLPAHPATMQQIFLPTSESRRFTRADAGKAFDATLLPADERIPHPELIELERERNAGLPREERIARQRTREADEEAALAARQAKRRAVEEKTITTVKPAAEGGAGGRWAWRFQDVSVQDAGRDGRDGRGVGWRYGVPHGDRKRGAVKIPTRV
ncbi:MAG: hypothetical protein M1832_005720 [Thelocarpon impressellum]|nr:MAG: hypothetical protein M1832_005720 [Thelocarpon impressellum]